MMHTQFRRAVLPCALAALAIPAPAADAQGPDAAASCTGILTSSVAAEQFRDDVSYFVKLGAKLGLRRNMGEFFSFYAQQHAGSIDACEAIPEP